VDIYEIDEIIHAYERGRAAGATEAQAAKDETLAQARASIEDLNRRLDAAGDLAAIKHGLAAVLVRLYPGNKIEAIREYRTYTGSSLREAKDAIEGAGG
jgi:ribosomal protein L7/L12